MLSDVAMRVGDVVYRKLDRNAPEVLGRVKRASELGIGPKYSGITDNYFLTEFCESVEPVWDDATETLMNKILNSELKYHPDFWFKNIVQKDGEYLAIDWEPRGTDWSDAPKEVRKDIMMARYNNMLDRWRRDNPPVFGGADDAFLRF